MAFDVPTLLRMLNIDPHLILGKVDELQSIAKHFEARLVAIEEKQDHIVALLEALLDNSATDMLPDGDYPRKDGKILRICSDPDKYNPLVHRELIGEKNGNHPDGATIYSAANVGGKLVTFNPSGPIET